MSLIRQLWILLVVTVLVALLGSVLVSVGAARGYLETQLRLKNSDNAQSLALALTQQASEPALAELAIAAQFDTGFYERIALLAPDGRVLVERRAEPRPAAVPAWFVQALPIASVTGVAQVSDGWRPVGTLEVVSTPTFAYEDLWQGSLRTAGWLMLVGACAGALASLVLRRIRAPLQATVDQAQALVERRFVQVEEPKVPELRQLSRAMNAMVGRLQKVFGEQGAQIESLRKAAESDPLTGLAHRARFMTGLQAMMQREDGPALGTLLLLRLRALGALNRGLGHAQTDALLRALADTLSRHAESTVDALCGRLNGSDFALFQPCAPKDAGAERLLESLQSALAAWPQAGVALGCSGCGTSISALMQSADAALARAEARAGYSVEIDVQASPADGDAAVGEGEWQRRLERALHGGAAKLGSFPVVDRAGALLHLEAPLRLRLLEGGADEPAARWLPWVLRTGLSSTADLLAVRLALDAIAADGQPRGVNIASDSLTDSGFVPQLRSLLQSGRRQAHGLWLEVGEHAAIDRLGLMRELGQQVRPLGAKLGLEHAGARLAQTERLYEAGLDYIKLDASMSLGIVDDRPRTDFLRGLVSMLHGLGALVYAEGVSQTADAEVLWACGIDGMTGPWVGSALRPGA